MNEVTLYKVDKKTSSLTNRQGHSLDDQREGQRSAQPSRISFSWLDDRYAITSSHQTGNTSLTLTGWKVIGPSVWLIDAVLGKGKIIIGPAQSPSHAGIYKACLQDVVGRSSEELKVGEEDSMDATVNLQAMAGKELPADFKMTHEPRFDRLASRRGH